MKAVFFLYERNYNRYKFNRWLRHFSYSLTKERGKIVYLNKERNKYVLSSILQIKMPSRTKIITNLQKVNSPLALDISSWHAINHETFFYLLIKNWKKLRFSCLILLLKPTINPPIIIINFKKKEMKYSVIVILAALLILGQSGNITTAWTIKCDADLYE